MCHFYANPLSALCSSEGDDAPQPEHLEAVRNLPSFRHTVERLVERNTNDSLERAKLFLEDDRYLVDQIRCGFKTQQSWVGQLLRSLLVLRAAGAQRSPFSKAYVDSLVTGAHLSGDYSSLVQCIRRMNPDDLVKLLEQVISIYRDGDSSLSLGACADERDQRLQRFLETKLQDLQELMASAEAGVTSLRSKYSAQSKVMRTTVIAQKVQLSQDSAALRDEDKRFTELVDDITSTCATHYAENNPNAVLFAECWLYESKSPSRDVFVPRPRAAFERSLGRPHDYLGCSCCKSDHGGLQATLPPTSILYQLYLETGNLINVADLWSAFHALVSQEEADEKTALVMFYRGLAEMRALGFVKGSKKKVDHVAKVRWL